MSFIAAGSIIVGGVLQHQAGRDATRAQTRGQDASIAEQRRQFDLTMQMLQPQISTGTQALNQLGSLYGFAPSAVPNATATTAAPASPVPGAPGSRSGVIGDIAARLGAAPTNWRDSFGAPGGVAPAAAPATASPGAAPSGMAGFFASPDYQFRRDEGNRDIANSFSAQGGAQSGNALRRLTEFNSGLAAGEFGNYFNRLGTLAGIGSTATSQGVGAAQNMGNNVSNALVDSGNARASGIVNRSNSVTDALNQFGQLRGYGQDGGGWGGFGNWARGPIWN